MSADATACLALSDCWFRLGECQADQGEHTQAIDAYKRCWYWWQQANTQTVEYLSMDDPPGTTRLAVIAERLS